MNVGGSTAVAHYYRARHLILNATPVNSATKAAIVKAFLDHNPDVRTKIVVIGGPHGASDCAGTVGGYTADAKKVSAKLECTEFVKSDTAFLDDLEKDSKYRGKIHYEPLTLEPTKVVTSAGKPVLAQSNLRKSKYIYMLRHSARPRKAWAAYLSPCNTDKIEVNADASTDTGVIAGAKPLTPSILYELHEEFQKLNALSEQLEACLAKFKPDPSPDTP